MPFPLVYCRSNAFAGVGGVGGIVADGVDVVVAVVVERDGCGMFRMRSKLSLD